MTVFKMSKINLLLFFIVFCNACFCYGQSDSNYDIPGLVQNVGQRMAAVQNVREASSDPDALSVLDQFKDLPIANLVPMLKMLWNQVGDNRCKQDIQYLYNNLKSKDMWGIKMIDALGKPSSGFLEGNFKWMGNYHECTGIHVPINENATAGGFNGEYCSMDLSLNLLGKSIPLTYGFCVPDSCENELIHGQAMFSLMNPMKSLVNITKLTCQPTSRKITPAAVGVICLLSFFVLFAFIGSSFTAYEYFFKPIMTMDSYNLNAVREKDGSYSDVSLLSERNSGSGWYRKVKPFFECFCVFSNGGKLLSTEGTEGQLLCLHGIRFLSMSWVIVCHTYAFCFNATGNLAETVDLLNKWPFQIILNGFYSVDSFFLLSGFLVAYLYFQEASKSDGKFPWVYFYVHRYIRLTPVYVIVIGINTALVYYMGSGPFWTVNPVEKVCKDNWWYNILYINNFAAAEKQCLAWAWYLANDMQFFVVSPLFLITLFKWPTVGFSVIGIFLSAAFAANFGITYHYDLFSGLGNISSLASNINLFLERFAEFFDKIYIKPYTRISPYLVGIAVAYILFQRKRSNKGKINMLTLSVGWIVSTVVTLTCLFVLYDREMTTVGNSFYNALNRTCFAGGLAWVIFTCLSGQGGPVNGILSFKMFIPLSRLTYCAYLIHPMFIVGYFNALKAPLHFTHMTLVTLFLGLLVITYAGAFVVSVLFESPIIKLDKFVRNKFKS